MSLDAVHFCQHGSRCRLSVPWEDDDPVVWHYPGRKSVGYFGAVRVRDGKSFSRKKSERFNRETFWAFLRQLVYRLPRKRATSYRHRRQLQLPSRQTARNLKARTAGQIWFGLPAALQPRVKPDRARLETNLVSCNLYNFG